MNNLEVNQKRLVEQFIKLVKINSPSYQERKIADYLKNWLKELGLEVVEDNVNQHFEGTTGNLIARLEGDQNKPTIMFSAHLDIVKSAKGVNPLVENGIIRTDGKTILGADDKAGIVAIMEAINLIQEQEISHRPIELVFTVAEESGLFGSTYLDYDRLDAKYAFVLDSGGPVGTIIVSAPAEEDLDIEIHGKAAHAGVEPEKGISAIKIAGELLHQLTIGRIDKETTANIGIIKGGEATNIITDYVSMKGEVRSRKEERLKEEVIQIQEICNKLTEEWGAEIKLDVDRAYPGFNLSQEDEVVRIAMNAANAIKVKSRLKPRGGGSDANLFNGKGIPAVNLGTGVKDNHTVKEQIEIKDLINLVRLIIEISTKI